MSKSLRLLVFFVASLWAAAPIALAQEEGAAKAEKSAEHAPPTGAHEGEAKTAAGHETGGHEAGGHAAGEHAHDDTDLSHGNASPALPDPTEIRFDMSIFSLLVFLILLGVLYKFAWGPIASGLSRREETIARQMEEARVAAEKAGQQLKEYEARLALATEEARGIVAQARKDAEGAKDRIVAEAQGAAQKEREKAVADINTAKNQALHEIAEKSVSTAITLASNIIRREVRPEDHDKLIDESLQKFSRLN